MPENFVTILCGPWLVRAAKVAGEAGGTGVHGEAVVPLEERADRAVESGRQSVLEGHVFFELGQGVPVPCGGDLPLDQADDVSGGGGAEQSRRRNFDVPLEGESGA